MYVSTFMPSETDLMWDSSTMAVFEWSAGAAEQQDDLAGRLSMAGDVFISQLDANLGLLHLASESDERDSDRERLFAGLSPEQREAVGDGLGAVTLTMRKVFDAAKAGESGSFIPDITSNDAAVHRTIGRVVVEVFHEMHTPPRSLLLRRSVLLLVVSDFEVLLAQIITGVLSTNPGLSKLGDASISLAELEGLGDITAAQQLIIERKVDEEMRKKLDEWSSWFEDFGVKWKDMVESWCQFAEIFLRRNLFVHTGGTVSEQYRRGLRTAGCDEKELPTLGEKLSLDDAYVEQASEQLLAFGVLLVAGTWLQLRKGDPLPAEKWVSSRVERLLEREHFPAVKTICTTVLSRSRGRLRRGTELKMKTMTWVARRGLGEIEKVQAEVAMWDTSGDDLLFAHAKAVLLEQDDRAVEEIKELLRRDALTVVELVSSPLYQGLRERRPEIVTQVAVSEGLSIVTSDLEAVDNEVGEASDAEVRGDG